MRCLLALMCLVSACQPDSTGTPREPVVPDMPPVDDMRIDAAPDNGVDAASPGTVTGCDDTDADGDGFGATGACGPIDCDDNNAGIHPGGFEACNGIDEDCDGATDEGLNEQVCGVGACRVRQPNCANGAPQRCMPGEPVSETCNGIDDDCDGTVDEDGAPASCGVGACERAGDCENACTPGEPSPETCNGIDDDCDGVIDNGHRSTVVETGYSVLVDRHEVCDGGRERIGPNCNAAMNRFCAAQDCANTGFGPVENINDVAVVTCVTAAGTERVDYATLSQHHPDCDGGRERIGPACNAAIHRYCAANGHVSGFGPLESGPDFIWLACMGAPAQVVGTRYSVLTNHHGPCNGQGQRIGPDCNAAIHRFCRSAGHSSGYGPVENAGDELAVVCIGR